MSHPQTLVIATVVESEPRAIDEAISRAALAGADMIEVRLDAAPGVAPEQIGARAAVPLLASCRAERDGGWFRGSEDERVRLLARAARAGQFRLDVERGSAAERLQETVPDRIAVVSRHDSRETPVDMEDQARDLLSALRPGQIAKLVPTARSLSDLLEVRSVLAAFRDPRLAAFAMGEPGRASRVLCGAWGSAAVWAAARADAPGAAGQIDLDALLRLFRFRSLTAATRVFGVAGSPVGASLSPAMHNDVFARFGLDAVYVPLECDRADDLSTFARSLPLAGVSITVPLKVAILPYLGIRDGTVEAAGACNTLVGERGYNTDSEAALEEIRARIDPRGRRVTVIGAGGAARAAGFALRAAGASLTIATRGPVAGCGPAGSSERTDEDRGERLARELGARYLRIAALSADADAVLVHATSAPANDPVVPPEALRAAFVLDLRYLGPSSGGETALVAAARRAGAPASDGLGMLARQAAAQARLFTGHEVSWQSLLAPARSAPAPSSL